MSDPARSYLNTSEDSPMCKAELPKSVPLPSLKTYLIEKKAAQEAEDAKWAKALSDYEAAKVKAEAEGLEAPKALQRCAGKKDEGDLTVPIPGEAKDADLLYLLDKLGAEVEEAFEQSGELTCQIKRTALLKTLKLCRQDAALKYEMLADETAVHYPAAKGFAFSVVYHLTSISRGKRLRLRVLIPEGFEPESATQVYPSANWMEREIFDMFGIRFCNHPDMTRILNTDDWQGHPLRKDYPLRGHGERDVDFREDRSGRLRRIALEKAGQIGVNLKMPVAE